MIHFVRCQIWPVVDAVIICAVFGFAAFVLMDTLRNLWLNWGWQYPVLSSLVVALMSIVGWWIFGGIIFLSDPSHKPAPGAPAVQTQPAAVSSSTAAPSKAPAIAINADGAKLPEPEKNRPNTGAANTDVPNTDIYSLFSKGDTSLKVSRALKPYTGKVMTIDGTLIQVFAGGIVVMHVNNGPGAVCVFDAKWLDRLDGLKRDQAVTVRGKISHDQAGNDLQLTECELLEGGPAPSPSPLTGVLPLKESLTVTFENSKCLIVRVINHDQNNDAKIKSVAVFGIKDGKETQLLSTRVPDDPRAIPGAWRLDSVAMPCYIGARDAKNFETLILEANLSVYGNSAYFAEVTLQTGDTVRSELIPTMPHKASVSVAPIVAEAVALLEETSMHPLNAIRKAGAANLQSNEDVVEVNRQIAGRNHGTPFSDAIQKMDYLKFLQFSVNQGLPLGVETEIYDAIVKFYSRPTESVENPQLTTHKETLAKLLDKRERIKDMPDSPGFDMGQVRRRNQLQINEVREEIKRLEDEQSSRLTQL